VTGEVEKSSSVQEPDDVPFEELLVGTFNVQGDLFVDALQEAEKEEGLTTYFKSVEEVRGIAMYDDVEASEGASESGDDEASDTGITTGVIVAIAMGGIILILLVAMFVVKARRKRGNAAAAAGSGAKGSSAAKGRSAGTASTRRSSIRRSISRSFSRNVSTGWAKSRPPPESITCTASPTNSGEAEYAVEVGLTPPDDNILQPHLTPPSSPDKRSSYPQNLPPPSSYPPPSSSYPPPSSPVKNTSSKKSHRRSKSSNISNSNLSALSKPVLMRGKSRSDPMQLPPLTPPSSTSKKRSSQRVQRDVLAPAGKLGILIANTTKYGPAVHTIRPGSPMEGLMFVNDIIVSIDDVDTREYTAEQITKLMKETVREERKITVLSAHR
jgi:hypothetical protein